MRGREEPVEGGLPGPALGQVQGDPTRGPCEACGHRDEGAADRRGRRSGEPACVVCDESGRAGEVEPDHREDEPGAVRGEHPGRQMSEGSALQIGVDLFDDRVCPVCLVRHHGAHRCLVGGGEERVVPVGVEQRRLLHLVRIQVRDAPHHQTTFDPFGLLP